MTALAEFVKVVEQFPCIYNSDLPDYARKEITDKAWMEVAQEMGWTVIESKDKWKNIRNGFVRSMKPSLNGAPKKPYYLTKALQFIIPYVNPNVNLQIDRIQSVKEESEPTQTDAEDGDHTNEEDDDVRDVEIKLPVVKKKRKRPAAKSVEKKTDVDKALVSWLQNKKSKLEDPREMFLLSLLPDVKSFTEEQLGVFRIKVLLLLEEVKMQSGNGLQELLKQCKKF